MDPRYTYIKEVFTTLVSKNNTDLATGVQRREDMLASLKRGEQPQGYRAEWIRESARRLIDELEQIAKDFNAKHPNDRCSAQDLMDVLATTMAWFKKATSK